MSKIETICQKNQDIIQQQEQGSKYQMKDQNLQTRKETHCRFHDRI